MSERSERVIVTASPRSGEELSFMSASPAGNSSANEEVVCR